MEEIRVKESQIGIEIPLENLINHEPRGGVKHLKDHSDSPDICIEFLSDRMRGTFNDLNDPCSNYRGELSSLLFRLHSKNNNPRVKLDSRCPLISISNPAPMEGSCIAADMLER